MKNLLFLILVCTLTYSCNNSKNKSTEPSKENTSTAQNVSSTKPSSDAVTTAANTGQKVQGIDISHYQTNIDWSKVKDDQISFVFVKATGGETYVDPSFKQHWEDVKQADIIRGAYHFYYTKDDPVKQAKFFIDQVLSSSQRTDLPPIVDIETAGVNTDITPAELQDDIQTFLIAVEKAFQKTPMLYTSHAFAQKYLDNTELSKYPLWLAEYQASAPPVPDAWASTGWTFWQNTPSATVNGIQGEVDHDIFNGNLEELKLLR